MNIEASAIWAENAASKAPTGESVLIECKSRNDAIDLIIEASSHIPGKLYMVNHAYTLIPYSDTHQHIRVEYTTSTEDTTV